MEEIYNIIVIGKYGNKEKEELIKYFGNPSKSYLNIGKKEYSESDLKNNEIECYTRQINELIFKGIRIIFIKNFNLNIDLKNKLFNILIEGLNRKGLICFHLSEEEKINIFKNIIEYEIESYDQPLYTFIENEQDEKVLIKMKNNLFKKIKNIPCERKSNAIYSKRIKFINKKYLIFKLIRDYHTFNYINNKDIILQFDLQDLNYEHTINLMMCGRKRAGKSSLVNLLLGEEVSYADSGNSITKGILEYKHKKYNLCIFDTVGFDKKEESKELPKNSENEDKNENVDTVINEIIKYEEENKIYKKKIHLFLFCINFSSGFFDCDEEKFLKFLLEKKYKIMIILNYIKSKSQQKKAKKNLEEELQKIKIKEEKINELVKNAAYLDLFDSSNEDFGQFLRKILDNFKPEIEKLKLHKFKETVFWEESDKAKEIKEQVLDSLSKYKTLNFLSAYIPIPGLDIYSEYKVREYMYDKIADIYKYYLEDKIPDNYKDPDVRKIVARASKYTLLNSDGSFYPKEKYKDIYEKLKKYNNTPDPDSHIDNIQKDCNKNDDKEPLLDKNIEMEKKTIIEEDGKTELKNLIKSKKQFEDKYYSKEDECGINDIQQTNCSVEKGISNISNTTLKAGTIAGGIGIQYGVKEAIRIGMKEISKKFLTWGVPIIGHIVSGTIFGSINLSSLNEKIDIIIKEIDESLTRKEEEEIIEKEFIETFDSLENNYLKEFSKDGNNYDVDLSGLDSEEK